MTADDEELTSAAAKVMSEAELAALDEDHEEVGAGDLRLLDAVHDLREAGEAWAEADQEAQALIEKLGAIPPLTDAELDRVAVVPEAEPAELGPLLADGVLLLASGNLTHNLGDFHLSFSQGGGTPAYVAEFADWMWQELAAGNENALLAYRERAPQAVRAHPSEEHLLPLYVALGAAGVGYRPERLYHGIDSVVLAMDSYAFWPANDNPQ